VKNFIYSRCRRHTHFTVSVPPQSPNSGAEKKDAGRK